MFIYSLRSSTLKFIAVVIVSIGALVTLIAVLPGGGERTASAAVDKKIDAKNIKTNEARVNFLSKYGWKVDDEPVEVIDVIIPKEFDAVFVKYNAIQKQQGMGLDKHKGRTVKRYTYTVANYPNHPGTVYVNLLMYRDCVIAGDICTAEVEGFMHGLDRANVLQ